MVTSGWEEPSQRRKVCTWQSNQLGHGCRSFFARVLALCSRPIYLSPPPLRKLPFTGFSLQQGSRGRALSAQEADPPRGALSSSSMVASVLTGLTLQLLALPSMPLNALQGVGQTILPSATDNGLNRALPVADRRTRSASPSRVKRPIPGALKTATSLRTPFAPRRCAIARVCLASTTERRRARSRSQRATNSTAWTAKSASPRATPRATSGSHSSAWKGTALARACCWTLGTGVT